MAISIRLLTSIRQCPSCAARYGHRRTWTSVAVTSRSTPSSPSSPPTRFPRPPSNSVPDLCLGAGGKAPGFVQQMLFSAPVQEKNPKGTNIELGRSESNLWQQSKLLRMFPLCGNRILLRMRTRLLCRIHCLRRTGRTNFRIEIVRD